MSVEEIAAVLVERMWDARPYVLQSPAVWRYDAALRAAMDAGVGEHPEWADDVLTDRDT